MKFILIALSISFLSLFSTQAQLLAQDVSVGFELVKPKGYLKHDYRAGVFHITNDGTQKIKIYDVDFTGDKPIEHATQEAKSHDKAALKVLWAFGIGFFWLFLIPTAIALIATPFVLIKRGMTRSKTRKEEWEYTEKKPREIELAPEETKELVAIFPEEMLTTRLEFSAKNLETGTVTHFEEKYILDQRAYDKARGE